MSFWHKKYGFTLAEVLVTLGLLGSVAALTIPTLAYNYRGKVLEQQFRSTYSEIKEIGARMNLEKGDVGEFAYSCVYGNSSKFKCGAQTAAGENKYSGTLRWASEFMSYIPGGAPFDKDVNSNNNIAGRMKEIYKEAGAPQGPKFFQQDLANRSALVCDNGGIWTDSKGRLWTFNGENQFICVDINGTAAPNKMNVDIFMFKPMTAKEMAVYINNEDPNEPHTDNYTGQFITCDLNAISQGDRSNATPASKGFRKGSGSGLDWCYFNEPIENVAAMNWEAGGVTKENTGTSARGKTMTRQNNYWKDYIDYR